MKRPVLILMVLLLFASMGPGCLLVYGLMGQGGAGWEDIFYRPFLLAAARTFRLLGTVTLFSLLIGLPLGILAGVFRFPLKGFALGLLALPLVMPPFLWAIGIQSLQPYFAFVYQRWFDGFWGCVLTGMALVIPLVVVASWSAIRQVSRSEMDALILVNEQSLRARVLFQRAFPAGLGAALIGAILVVADPGPGQIMGYHGISGDVLVAFSARNDFSLAAIKSFTGAVLYIPLIALAVWALLRGIKFEDLSRDCKLWSGSLLGVRARLACMLCFLGVPLLIVFASFTGLIRPLLHPPRQRALDNAWGLFSDSIGTTLFYGFCAAGLSVMLGLLAAYSCRRRPGMIPLVIAISLVLISLPSSMTALGVVLIGTESPAWLDFIFRSEWTVGWAMALRFLPVSTLLLLGFTLQIPRSIGESARILGVPLWLRLSKIYLPLMWPALIGTFLAVALLTLADVSSMVLLQPPGGASFGTHLFSVMDNASEKVVASLCLVYAILPILAVIVSMNYLLISRRLRNSITVKS